MKGIMRRIVLFLVNHVWVGTKNFEKKRKVLNLIGYEIGEGTKIVGPFYNTGKLVIGKNCWIGRNFTVHGNGVVKIGDNCDIAPDVTFLTGGHEIGDIRRRAGKGEIYSISVGCGTWIGARTTIMKNICVGKGCVVAACSCVVNDIEDNVVIGGVPAKRIRRLND